MVLQIFVLLASMGCTFQADLCRILSLGSGAVSAEGGSVALFPLGSHCLDTQSPHHGIQKNHPADGVYLRETKGGKTVPPWVTFTGKNIISMS